MSRGNPMDQGYVMVADRHAQFVVDHPNGLVNTELAGFSPGLVVVRCSVWKDRADADNGKMPDGTGMASMPVPGPTPFTVNSEVENAETSALGRALAMIGYHPKNTMASGDEIEMKAAPEARKAKPAGSYSPAVPDHIIYLNKMIADNGLDVEEVKAVAKAVTGKTSRMDLTAADVDAIEDFFAKRDALP